METEIAQKLAELEAKIDDARASLKKIQRYFQITFWITIVLVVLPLFGALYAVPKAMNSYINVLNGGDLQGLEGLY